MRTTLKLVAGVTSLLLLAGCAREAGGGGAFIELGKKKHTRWISAVAQKAGADVWPGVTRLKFTLTEVDDGEVTSRTTHDWDVRAGIDTITENGKTLVARVNAPAETAEQSRALALHTLDTFVLLLPMKLGESGITTLHTGGAEFDSRMYDVLTVSTTLPAPNGPFDAKVYVDPLTVLVRALDPQNDGERLGTMTFDGYQNFNGLLISTQRRAPHGRWRLDITDVTVTR